MRDKARAAGLLTPHIRADGSHLSQRATARVLQASGLSPLAPLALNPAAPDEGNMLLLGSVATVAQNAHFLPPLVAGNPRSAFLTTEPAADGGAGAAPSSSQTWPVRAGGGWGSHSSKAVAP